MPDDPSEYPTTTTDLDQFNPAETYRDIDIGSRDGVAEQHKPHLVRIWNTTSISPVSVRVMHPATETFVHTERYKIPTDTQLVLTLLEPAEYLVEVCVPTAETILTLRVMCRMFDCNSSRTDFGIFEQGEIRSSWVSTTTGCSGPRC